MKKETNKISNAKELVNAVFSDGGPKNTKMCVLTINKTVAKFENKSNVKNISYYHSMKFTNDGVLYREYYDIGKGKFHEYSGSS